MTLNELWQKVLGELELQTSRANFQTWLKGSSLLEKKQGVAVIGVTSNFAKEWVANKYHKSILKYLRLWSPEIKSVKYIIKAPVLDQVGSLPKKISKNQTRQAIDNQLGFQEFGIDQKTGLNPKYQLENFVVGSSNELAYAAANAIIENPGKKYNPLFIYGGVGLGKTHLIQAVGNKIKEKYKNRKIKYVSAEKFTNEVVDAIRNKNTRQLKDKYRTVDVLIIDDIQFISGKEKTQEEFFHTFNTLYEENKQVIISSDRPPKSIPTLEERLRSRFEGGMIADIGIPDYETRLAILKQKVAERTYFLPENILEFLAQNIQNNIRELEGALNSVVNHFQVKNIGFSVQEVEKVLQNTIQPKRMVSAKEIIKTVAEFYDALEEDLLSHCRRKELVKPRQILMYLLRQELDMSYPAIGQKLGNRDHTTVIHACEKIVKTLTQDSSLFQEINIIKERLYTK